MGGFCKVCFKFWKVNLWVFFYLIFVGFLFFVKFVRIVVLLEKLGINFW